MKKLFFRLPEDISPQARNAFRITLIGLPAAGLAASFYLYLGLTAGAWQLYAWSVDIWLLALVILISMILIRRDRVSLGVWLFLIAIPMTFIAAVALIEGIGLLVGVSIAILLSVMGGQTLSGKAISRANILGVSSGAAAVLLDLFGPAYRLPQPEPIRVFLPGILGVVILLYGYFALRQFREYSLRTRLLLGFLSILALVSLFGVFSIRQQLRQAEQTSITEASHLAEALSVVTAKEQVDLQELVNQLHKSQGRDVVVLNLDKQILADADPSEIGLIFEFDPNGEVSATLKDGQPRTFVENTSEDPLGFKQVVVPIQKEADGTITGAVIMDYNQTVHQVQFAEADSFAEEVSAILADDPAGLQNFISVLYRARNRDLVVVDRQRQILADTVPENVGTLYKNDLDGEVANTLKDGQPRTFVESNVSYPQGIQKVITPIKDSGGTIMGVAILGPASEAEEAAIAEASHLAEAISIAVSQNQARVQELVNQLHKSQGRGIAVVNLDQRILADVVPEEVGLIFESDEVSATLKDGQARTFVEITSEEPQGLKQVVVPIRDESGEINGAVILEYTAFYEELQRAATTAARTLIALGIAALFAALLISQFITASIANPLTQLSNAAQKIGDGQLDTSLPPITSKDQIGSLAAAFSKMTAQLRTLIGSLEGRVAARTRNLELAAEVGRTVSQVRALDVMLKDAAELIRKQFDLYYVQVYLVDPSQTNLILQSGTGSVGERLLSRHHHLPLNTGSINGRAAIEKKSVVISDATTSSTFKPNPLLPNTRSEMAVPLLVGEKVVGVLDMQSEHAGALTPDGLPAFEALAGQLAIAIQNANLLAETEQARAEVEKQAARLVRANWKDYLDAIHQPEEIGFLFDQNQVVPLSNAQEPPEEALTAPIAVTGESLGTLVVEIDKEKHSAQSIELVNTVARQVAQQIENLRLLESAERYRSEAEQAARHRTHEGWQEYVKSRATSDLGYLYDSNEVRPSQNGKAINESAFTLPLKARDETIGNLSVNGLTPDDKDSVELVHAVAEQLGAHIDSLRQYEQTQSALAQSERLFDASRRLTQATDLQELVASSVAALSISEVNRVLLTSFDYDSAGEVKQLTVTGNWWNGEGTAVTPIGTQYPLEVIRVMPMFVSSTPVFFDDTFTDERVDATTMDLVKKLNLRAVAVLPLHLGSKQIGALILEAEKPHHFTIDETRLFASLAPQIATILENRQQYEKAQSQAKREAVLNMINQKIQSATTVDAVLQIAARELGSALGAPLTIAQLGLKNHPNGN